MTRRTFLNQTTLGVLAASTAGVVRGGEATVAKGEVPLIVSTWPFGKAANDEALRVLDRGDSLLDAVEQGIWVTESAGDGSVGLMNSAKRDKVGERQVSHAEKLRAAGLLSREGLEKVKRAALKP